MAKKDEIWARVLYDYESQRNDNLGLRKGEVLSVIQPSSTGKCILHGHSVVDLIFLLELVLQNLLIYLLTHLPQVGGSDPTRTVESASSRVTTSC